MHTTKPTKHILWAVSSTTFLVYFLVHLHFNYNKLFFQALFVTRKVAETQIIECSDLSYYFALCNSFEIKQNTNSNDNI